MRGERWEIARDLCSNSFYGALICTNSYNFVERKTLRSRVIASKTKNTLAFGKLKWCYQWFPQVVIYDDVQQQPPAASTQLGYSHPINIISSISALLPKSSAGTINSIHCPWTCHHFHHTRYETLYQTSHNLSNDDHDRCNEYNHR